MAARIAHSLAMAQRIGDEIRFTLAAPRGLQNISPPGHVGLLGLIRAGRDFAEKELAFAARVSLYAIKHLLDGRGYEPTTNWTFSTPTGMSWKLAENVA